MSKYKVLGQPIKWWQSISTSERSGTRVLCLTTLEKRICAGEFKKRLQANQDYEVTQAYTPRHHVLSRWSCTA